MKERFLWMVGIGMSLFLLMQILLRVHFYEKRPRYSVPDNCTLFTVDNTESITKLTFICPKLDHRDVDTTLQRGTAQK